MKKGEFLQSVFDHCLEISTGACSISNEDIHRAGDEMQSQILYGLLYMHEDIEHSKAELAQSLQEEYDFKLLKEKNKELEQFAYKASHDLKEPIRTIKSFTELLKNRYSHNLDAKAMDYLEYIDASSKRMTQLISKLLEYARFGNRCEFAPVDLNEIISSIEKDLSSQIKKCSGQIFYQNLPQVRGDRTMMRLLFQNLISNGLKFSKENQSPIIQISSESRDNMCQISIRDNGIGIKESHQAGIFDIFTRIHETQAFEGTGIGLAHCKKIVELHKGNISVESQINKGSTFRFSLKKEEPATVEQAQLVSV